MIGKTETEARTIADNYLRMVSNKEFDAAIDLEEAAVYAGVRQFPARVKCASIAWQAFVRTLDGRKDGNENGKTDDG
jgi:NifU-like protein involved in Fe-S cluster formation